MPENEIIPINEGLQTAQAETAQEKFERERLTRRQALKKFGMTSAMAAFALFSVDDLAHMVGKAMQQRAGDNKVAAQVAQEFQQAGIAFATTDSTYPCTDCTGSCVPDDEYDCVDCTPDPSCPVEYGFFGKTKKKQAKMPVECSTQEPNCEACMGACQKLCLKKGGLLHFYVCDVDNNKCQQFCDTSEPNDNGAAIWDCWKKDC